MKKAYLVSFFQVQFQDNSTYQHSYNRNEKDYLHQPVEDEEDTSDHFEIQFGMQLDSVNISSPDSNSVARVLRVLS